MRILLGLHHVTLGGDTINALELASRLTRRGHDASLFALVTPGLPRSALPLVELAEQRGVRLWTFRTPTNPRERLGLVRQLGRFAREQGIDVVHSFGHQDTYYAFLGTYGLAGVPLVVNDYGMTVTPGLPRRVPLVVGTREVEEQGRRSRPGQVHLVEPPVDLDSDRPGAVDGCAFRSRLGITDEHLLVVVVSRLVRSMKGEGLHASIEAVRLLDDPAVRLAIVGDGGAAEELAEHADRVGAELGRRAVLFAGPMVDPAPGYAAADVVLGMGHSGLRAMAFGKPLVVLGERGFAMPLTKDTVAHVDYHGVYGVGDGGPMAPRIAAALRPLLRDPQLRTERGSLGRELASRYAIDSAAERLERIYQDVRRPRSLVAVASDSIDAARSYVPAKLRRANPRRAVR